MEQWVVAGLLVWITLSCGVLIWMRSYEECIIGGVGLSGLIIVNVITLRDMLYGTYYYNFLPATIWSLVFIALIITQHVLQQFKRWWREGRKTGQKLFY